MKVKTHKKPIYIIIDDLIFSKLKEQITYWNANLLKGSAKLNLDFMVYFIDLISKKSVERKTKLVNGYIRLNSKYLKQVLHNYNYQIDFLINKKIIERIPYSKHNNESYGYKIIIPKKSLEKRKFRTYDFISFTIRKKLYAKQLLLQEEADKKTAHITKWLKDSIVFDHEAATKYMYSINMKDSKLYHRLYCCEVLKRSNITYSRNGKDNRLHSTLTSLPSELRRFLKFKSNENDLVSLDIKSSQPFHLAGIINLILENNYQGLEYLSTLIKEDRLRNKFLSSLSVMIPKMSVEPANAELKRFVSIVTKKDLYEYLGSEFSEEHLNRIQKDQLFRDTFYNASKRKKEIKTFTTLRNYCKLAMLEYMYCSVKSKEQRYLEIRRILPDEINEIVDILKEVNYNLNDSKSDFPIILQNIEAGLFLDVICKQFSLKYRETPFITIHDSIIIDESMKEITHNFFSDSYMNIFGVTATLD